MKKVAVAILLPAMLLMLTACGQNTVQPQESNGEYPESYVSAEQSVDFEEPDVELQDNEALAWEPQIIQIGTARVSIRLPDDWEAISYDGSAPPFPHTDQTYLFVLLPPGEDPLGVIYIGNISAGQPLSPEDFLAYYLLRVTEHTLPNAVEETAAPIEVSFDGGEGLFDIFTYTEPGQWLYRGIFMGNFDNGTFVSAALRTLDTESDSFKLMLNALAGMEMEFD